MLFLRCQSLGVDFRSSESFSQVRDSPFLLLNPPRGLLADSVVQEIDFDSKSVYDSRMTVT